MLDDMFRFCLDTRSKFNKEVKKFNLTFSQWQVLKVINKSDKKKLSLNEIIELTKSDKASISLIVDKLLEKDMVEKTVSEIDKRKKYITLTYKMKKNCLRLKEIENSFLENLFSNLSKEEKLEFQKILYKLMEE